FLKGTAQSNANAAHVTATFWLETLQSDTEPRRLQYSQLVILNFNGISWPHITVGTLQKACHQPPWPPRTPRRRRAERPVATAASDRARRRVRGRIPGVRAFS